MCTLASVSVVHSFNVVKHTSNVAVAFAAIGVAREVQALSCGAGLANHRIAQREGDAKPEADAFYGAEYTAGAA